MLLILGTDQHGVGHLRSLEQIVPMLKAHRILQPVPRLKAFPPFLDRLRHGNYLKLMRMRQRIFQVIDAAQARSDQGDFYFFTSSFPFRYSLTLPTVIPLTKYFCRNGYTTMIGSAPINICAVCSVFSLKFSIALICSMETDVI